MIKRYKNRAIIGFVFATCCFLCNILPVVTIMTAINSSSLITTSIKSMWSLMTVLMYLTWMSFFYGMYNLAKSKGYEWYYMLLGLLFIIGLIIVIAMKDKTLFQKDLNKNL